jgi:anti-sigma regulatory factor (Ser/Thr protein kinase)
VSHARRVASRISELRPLAAWVVDVARTLGCPRETCADADLCVTEAVANIVRHGHLGDAQHEVGVEIEREQGALVIRIEDDARHFDPLGTRVLQPTSLDEAGPAGRGLLLIRRTADAVSYERRNGLNQLTLRFALGK